MGNNRGYVSFWTLLFIVFVCLIAYSAFKSSRRPVQTQWQSDSKDSAFSTGVVGNMVDNVKIISDGGFFSPAAKRKDRKIAAQRFINVSSSHTTSSSPASIDEAYPDLAKEKQ